MEKLHITNVFSIKSYLTQQVADDDRLIPIEIWIEKGKIVAFKNISENILYGKFEHSNFKKVDGKSNIILPAFMDAHVHLRFPGGEHKESMETALKAAVKGGHSIVVAMPNTTPTTDCPEVVNQILKEAKKYDLCEVLVAAAVTKGLKGQELTDFKALKKISEVVGLTDDGRGIQSDQMMEQAMGAAFECQFPILDHAEDDSLSLHGAIHQGKVSEKFHVRGINPLAEIKHVKRGVELAEKTGCHYHVLHISCKESMQLVENAQKRGLPVSCEVAPHHLLLADEDIKTLADGSIDSSYKMNPPLRSVQDRDYLKEAFIKDRIAFLASDHAPHCGIEKKQEIHKAPFGIVGLETSFPLIYTAFVKSGKLKLKQLVDSLTIKPWDFYKIGDRGMQIGCWADLVVVDIKTPQLIDPESFASKGRNSPFVGYEVFGIPQITFVKGKKVFDRREGKIEYN